MKFVFVCPEKQETFEMETEDFKVVENKGVAEDEGGTKRMDAKVELTSPCPQCGKSHIFDVNELTCPFT